MSEDARVYNMAKCLDCPADKGGHDRAFTSHEERANWKGKHRLSTGHRVSTWLEAKKPGVPGR